MEQMKLFEADEIQIEFLAGEIESSEKKSQSKQSKSELKTQGRLHLATLGLAYLNQVTGRKFRKTKDNLKGMGCRLKDGYSYVDILLVIDFKWCQWRHVKTDRGPMAQYVNPITLFRSANFGRYLEEAKRWDAQGRPEVEEGRVRKESEVRAAMHGALPPRGSPEREAFIVKYRAMRSDRIAALGRQLTQEEEAALKAEAKSSL